MQYLEDQETNELTTDFVELIKELIDSEKKHETYGLCCEHAQEMAVHLYGYKPTKLLNMVRPREEDETKQYRLDAYQPTTKATAGKALSIVSKIFNPTLYSIQWGAEGNSQLLKKYTTEEYPKHKSVITFLQQVALKKTLADPNGVMAIHAHAPDSDLKRAEPTVKLYGSESIWHYTDQMYLFFKKKERDRKYDWYYFDYYDEVKFVTFRAAMLTRKNITIEELSRYEHNIGKLPVWTLGGIPEAMDNGTEIYKSYFEPAVPFWNLAITHESDLFGAYINHLHPIRAELSEECDYLENGQKCKRGTVHFPDGAKKMCPSCHGSGLKSVKSPYGIYRYNKEKLSEGGATLEPVQYITVPTEPTKMLEERVEKQHEKGLYALNMDILNKIGENQSGIAKVIDRDELYDFLFSISTRMFGHLEKIFEFINYIMFAPGDINAQRDPSKNLPKIQAPTQFDISSAIELIEEMKLAKEAGLSPQFLREKQRSVNDKEFASNSDTKNKMTLITELDPCPDLSVDDLNLVGGKFIPKEFIIIHYNIEFLVERLIEKQGDKLKSMNQEQKFEAIKKLAEELAEELEEKIDTSAIETGDTTEQFGNNPNNGKQQTREDDPDDTEDTTGQTSKQA